ncbi:protein of unknown function [Candidatus Nitrosocosmicus franklandus]|uniref:Uncharacterized protein n=1 Tax=Candidatus Nitrosocosmicus franklandianus TaxID=1798806 RepID=A0A484I8C9_9ARCH|nr:protein of unknown function [Candidatus Nitrosocosmicus franklandus]
MIPPIDINRLAKRFYNNIAKEETFLIKITKLQLLSYRY